MKAHNVYYLLTNPPELHENFYIHQIIEKNVRQLRTSVFKIRNVCYPIKTQSFGLHKV